MLAFYQAACGGKIVHGNNDLVWLKVGGVRVFFREMEDYQAPTWPSADIPAGPPGSGVVVLEVEADAR
jgi:hypothetical protein